MYTDARIHLHGGKRQMPGCEWFSLSNKIIHDLYFLSYLSKSSHLSTIKYVAFVIFKAF